MPSHLMDVALIPRIPQKDNGRREAPERPPGGTAPRRPGAAGGASPPGCRHSG